MPTYEYKCEKCGKIFEEFHSITAEPVKKCKFCSGKVRRLISPGAGFILKGNGFYATDYRKPDYKRQAQKEAAGTCPAGKKSSCANCPNSGK
ncbi:MAG: zinc ribbon domain-containing protein [Candidatus Omnitrophica bacterium]|jgi:putative FmdB family regulatory protein|nr:zinc ribbon domain-containing protein [Candidatus Omnitrophota bacterium]